MDVDQIKAEISKVQKDVARMEYERDTAAKAKATALDNLREFGVESEEEATQLLVRLRSELAEEMAVIKSALEIVE